MLLKTRPRPRLLKKRLPLKRCSRIRNSLIKLRFLLKKLLSKRLLMKPPLKSRELNNLDSEKKRPPPRQPLKLRRPDLPSKWRTSIT